MLPQRAPLSDGRWHFQHGPIDIVVGADGTPSALAQAHRVAWTRFQTVLEELVAELPLLRQPVPQEGVLTDTDNRFRGNVAQRMWNACLPFRAGFITPMAAVAGAVAQELIACYQGPGIDRAWVNNGGDIALHLTPGNSLCVGLLADLSTMDQALAGPDGLRTDAQATLEYELPVRGIATSGWRGRSFSLGIADSVTVLAATAAQADAAATVVANSVNVQHTAIQRQPACMVRDDSDLATIPVTTDVPRLPPDLVREALSAGLDAAQTLQRAGLLWSATLVCQGQWRQTAHFSPLRVGHIAQVGSVFA